MTHDGLLGSTHSLKKKDGTSFIKKKKKKGENSQGKNRKSLLLNKIMIHHIQNSRGRLILKITTKQLRQACFKTSYKREKAEGDGKFTVSFQQQSSSYA